MRVPRGRRGRGKGSREERRDAFSARLGRLEAEESNQPKSTPREGEQKVEKGPKRRRRLLSPRRGKLPATSRSEEMRAKDRETRAKDRRPEPQPGAAKAEKTEPDKTERVRKRRMRKPAGKPLARTASAARGAAAGARRSSTRGLRATAARTGPAWHRARSRAAAAGRRAQPRIDWLVTLVPRAILWAGRTLAAFGGTLAAVSTRLSRVITPERGIAAVICCSAACLGVSQFVTYRGVEVGEPQYLGVSGIAPPPQTDRIDAGAAHAYL